MNADTTSDDSNVELLVVHTDRILSGKLKLDEEEVENRLSTVFNFFNLYQTKIYMLNCIEKGWQKGCYQRNIPLFMRKNQ